jgi:hypothetical protein
VDVAGLLNQRDKIKVLMRRDPRFIGRLITVGFDLSDVWVTEATGMLVGAGTGGAAAAGCAQVARRHPAAPKWNTSPRRAKRAQQLDKHMHKMLAEKHERLFEIRADEEALATLDATIASHITPNLVRRVYGGCLGAYRQARASVRGLQAADDCRTQTPNRPQERLNTAIAEKTAQRAAIEAGLAQQLSNCRDLGKEVAALVSRARHTSGKLMVRARDRVMHAWGKAARCHGIVVSIPLSLVTPPRRRLFHLPQSKTASNRLQEARGFTSTVPTTQLIRGKPKGGAGAAAAAPTAASQQRRQEGRAPPHQPDGQQALLVGGDRPAAG